MRAIWEEQGDARAGWDAPASQLESKHDQLLRALAEADNARRRATIDVENAHKFAVSKFAKAMLDVADNLSRALSSISDEAKAQAGEAPFLFGARKKDGFSRCWATRMRSCR